jgi:hypothetical protein
LELFAASISTDEKTTKNASTTVRNGKSLLRKPILPPIMKKLLRLFLVGMIERVLSLGADSCRKT